MNQAVLHLHFENKHDIPPEESAVAAFISPFFLLLENFRSRSSVFATSLSAAVDNDSKSAAWSLSQSQSPSEEKKTGLEQRLLESVFNV
jgi:hypothetical protein